MQIGEKVRFLNEVGGGVISGFQGKDIVLVEDEDGFDIPMLRSQVVVIETNANNFVRKPKAQKPAETSEAPKPAATPAIERQSLKAAMNADLDFEEEDTDPADRPITFQPKPKERKGGEHLNVCLAFVPEDSRELTTTRFEGYLVNDSNYFVSVVLANNEGAAWHLRWQGTMEPNTKQLVETFDRSILNDLQRLSVQLIAWKQDKPFMLKPAVGVELRLDTVKFYKLHVFQPSPFFREPALIYDIVRDDRPIRQVFVEAEEVLDAMRGVEPSSPYREEAPLDPSVPSSPSSAPSSPSSAPSSPSSAPSSPSSVPSSPSSAPSSPSSAPFSPSSAPSSPSSRQPLPSLQGGGGGGSSSATAVVPVGSPTGPSSSPVPQRSRAEEREALKAAKRALKAEQQAKAAKKQQAAENRDPHISKPNHTPADDAPLEVDLHINALLDNTAGLSPAVLLNTQLTEFRIIMDRNIRKKGQRIVFIHGKGEGVLREALIKELRRRYRTCTYEDANFQKYGFGATMVTIR